MLYNIKVLSKDHMSIKGYLLDIYLNESKYIELNNIDTSCITSDLISVDSLINPINIYNLEKGIFRLSKRIKEIYMLYNLFSNSYIEVFGKYNISYNKNYCILYYKEADKARVAYIREVNKTNIVAEKIKSIDRRLGYTFFEHEDNTFKMKSSSFLLRNEYVVFGFQSYDYFKVLESQEIIEADILIDHIYSNNNFTAFAKGEFLKYPANKKIPSETLFIRGIFPQILIDDEFSVKGYWEQNPRGSVFNIIESKRVFSRNIKVMKNFLLISLKGNRIGRKTIDSIVDRFYLDSINVIKKSPEKLMDIKGISEKKAITIHEVIKESDYIEQTMSFFVKNKISLKYMSELYKKYGNVTIELIQENPYIILEMHGIPFKLVDRIAYNEKINHNDSRRVEASILYFLKNDEVINGNLFTYKDILLSNLNDFILKNGVYKEGFTSVEINKALEKLSSLSKIKIEHLISDYRKECIYLSYNNYLENIIVKKIKSLTSDLTYNMWDKDRIQKEILLYEMSTGFRLAKNQKEAVKMALTNKISILTGGPGTGKTQTINSIIHILKKLNPLASVELAAPTGKASDRMTQITGLEASTIHRKLGYIPYNDSIDLKEIDCNLLVIDESSMIDADLFLTLLENISDRTNVLFVGDYNQIPSVGAGLILRDLISSNEISTVRLNEIFRQDDDSSIINISHDIINGKTTKTGLDISNTKDFVFIQKEDDIDIKKQIIDIVSEERKWNNLNEIQVLTPLNIGDLGTTILNYELQDEFNPIEDENEEICLGLTKKFRLNDKVIQTKNNYDLNVFNGSLGNISSVDPSSKKPIIVNYDLDDIEYSRNDLDDLMLSYAMTIHKSQGSEFKVVIIPIHKSHLFMNNRNLLYTAITRAKDKVYLVGDQKVLDQIIEKEDCIERNSQIKDKLQDKKTKIVF